MTSNTSNGIGEWTTGMNTLGGLNWIDVTHANWISPQRYCSQCGWHGIGYHVCPSININITPDYLQLLEKWKVKPVKKKVFVLVGLERESGITKTISKSFNDEKLATELLRHLNGDIKTSEDLKNAKIIWSCHEIDVEA